MNLNKLTVKTKLSAAFGFLAFVLILASAVSLKELSDANDRFAHFVSGINARAQTADAIRAAVDDRAMAVRNLVLVSDPADVEIEKVAVVDAEKRVEGLIERFNAMISGAQDMSDQARALAAEIIRIEASYRPVALDINRLALANDREGAIREINTKCRPLLVSLIKASNAYSDLTHQRADGMIQQAQSKYSSQRALLIAICVVATALAAAAGIAITRGITRALGAEPTDLAGITKRVADGDLSSVIGAQTAPKGSVLASMGEMQLSLANLIGRVRTAADNIATGSNQIAVGNTDLSSRTEEQAAALQETASSMEELTSTVKQNADNAQQASALSTAASGVASKGNAVVGRVVATMGEISANSTKISDIIGIIEGIAFQTNILALNAAVEAARAGEEGRGFAVVAGEVRSLAQRSSGAAKEIKDLISASAQKVAEGGALAHDAGQTMSELTQAVERVADIMGEIAAASTEQSKGIEQVNQSVAQMDEVTQQNAALVEEAAAASASLEDQGRALTESVALFRFEQTAIV